MSDDRWAQVCLLLQTTFGGTELHGQYLSFYASHPDEQVILLNTFQTKSPGWRVVLKKQNNDVFDPTSARSGSASVSVC